MEFNTIIAVTGKPGLYHVLSQTKNAVIAESIIDKKRLTISATQDVSLLENIAMFTHEEDVPLLTIFQAMFEKSEGKEAISHKESAKKLTAYFVEILPDYDEERVYTSNIKKLVKWFNILVKAGFDFTETKADEEENTTEEA